MRQQTKKRQGTASPVVVTQTAQSAPWLLAVTILLTACCLLGLFSKPIEDTDFWWHLKTGQYVLENHALPVPDPFSYTSNAAPAYPGEAQVRHFNLTHEWLSQVLMYTVYTVSGFPGIILMRAVLLACYCGIAGFLAARLSANSYAGIAAACATAGVAIAFAADRPGSVSFLGVAVFVTLLELRRGYWALPLLALIWANCHGGFPLGWVVLLAYCGEALLRPAWTPENRRLWLASAAAILASGFNPNGFTVVSTLLAYRKSPMTANLIEWMPPVLWAPPYAFGILLCGAALVLALAWKRVRPVHWVLFAAFASASLMAFRNIPLIGFLGPVLIAAYFPFKSKMPSTVAWLAPAIAACGLAVVVARGGFQNMRVAEWLIPDGAAAYILEHRLKGPIFNTHEQGGYLIWKLSPQDRVFIDGRSLSESVYRDYKQILFNDSVTGGADQMIGPRAELLQRYGVDLVVMNTMDYVSGAMYPLALALANPATTGWDLVYEDTKSMVFLRNATPDTPPISNKLGHVLRHLNRECVAYIDNSPDDALCARTLADYWMHNQVRESARQMLSLYLAHAKRSDPKAERALRDLDAAPPQ